MMAASAPAVGTSPGDDIHAIVFEGSSSDGRLSAEVRFWQEGSNLKIQLTNTSLVNPLTTGEVLSALFFNVAGQPTLTPVSAVLATGSKILYPVRLPSDGVSVGGEWAYRRGDVKSPGNMEYGISATAFNAIFKPADRFPGENLAGNGNSMSSISFGLVGPGKTATGSNQMNGQNPFIQYSVIFTLSGLPPTFNLLTDITQVWFQYGTSLNDPSFQTIRIPQEWEPPEVPEPMTLGLLMLGSAGLILRRQ
jgi:hypothetical protein